jgi:hypothetical protein
MREFKAPVKLILFLSSYVPLFFIISLRLGSNPPLLVDGFEVPYIQFVLDVSWASAIILLLCVLFTASLYYIINVHSGRGRSMRRVDKYQKRNELVSMYLLVYVFVFAGLNFTNLVDILIFFVFFAILGITQVNSEMLHVNPMLGVRGYQAYEVTSDQQVILVITREELEEKMFSVGSESSERSQQNIELISLGATTYIAP